jgi:DNA replication protein DnaC
MNPFSQREQLRKEIMQYCRKLILSRNIVELCEHEATPKQEEFVHRVLKEEIENRELTRRTRLTNRANFPTYKTLEGYEYHRTKFPLTFDQNQLEQCRFIEEKKNLVLYGPVGTGKTHMAIATGVKACQLGYRVKFTTVTELVLRLSEARKLGTLERLIKELLNLDLLILDEWGYVPVDKEGSQLLFRVIADSYESKSLILTTNLEFSKWGGIFTDDQMAAAMIDRLVHHGHLILFEGQSYRMTHALMRQKSAG